MGEKAEKERRIIRSYSVEGGKVKRMRDSCPRCGPGVFMAVHEGRKACGRCGYTEYLKS